MSNSNCEVTGHGVNSNIAYSRLICIKKDSLPGL